MKIKWERNGATWKAEMADNVTLFASPVAMHRFQDKAVRGTKWRAGASIWDERTRTMSRYGRDCYMQEVGTAQEAMRLAETIYIEESSQ